ncbi:MULTISPECIES: S24 family peptidase [Streptococcus]|uniref:S24 family peptidase n=1 Tax=Streptococcus TaxID=1301 RepID=UPI00110C3D09|nr:MULTISPECIES: S24 family peptidase [Streptococcus]MBF9618449.1 helix-turn-helix domain-containing protein [Streptococcus pseudopneumoniae]NIB79033.1 helix-turn-helix domain-containing protein [Streptococcus pseudopneumoniae]TMR49617.1 helix-turn-helix domain-containing protein [Streptococcus pseudopneumoniae]
MTDTELAIYIGAKIKEFRLLRGLTQKELAKLVNIGDTTIANYEKGFRTPKKNTMFDLANAFNVSIDDLFPPIQKDTPPTTSPIQTIYDQLEPPRQGKVLTYAERQLNEQKNEEETKVNEVSEVISLYQVEVVSETAAASGFNYGFGYDDTDREIIEVDEQPPHHDIATKVSGDSMQPDYQDGDILYLVDKGLTTYNGDLAVIAYGDRSYFKKIYTENGRLRLVSLNDKYEDITLDFPPAEDTHIKIYAVIGVYRGE